MQTLKEDKRCFPLPLLFNTPQQVRHKLRLIKDYCVSLYFLCACPLCKIQSLCPSIIDLTTNHTRSFRLCQDPLTVVWTLSTTHQMDCSLKQQEAVYSTEDINNTSPLSFITFITPSLFLNIPCLQIVSPGGAHPFTHKAAHPFNCTPVAPLESSCTQASSHIALDRTRISWRTSSEVLDRTSIFGRKGKRPLLLGIDTGQSKRISRKRQRGSSRLSLFFFFY